LRLSDSAGKHTNHKTNSEKVVFPELVGCALIRELHVYGQTIPVKKTEDSTTITHQHMGFGRKLLEKSFEMARMAGYTKIAVISGNGVKNYYKKFGFVDDGLFLTKNLDIASNSTPTLASNSTRSSLDILSWFYVLTTLIFAITIAIGVAYVLFTV
jgi:hypothetical protein